MSGTLEDTDFDALVAEARGAVASAESLAELDELRVRFLGRRSQLATVLRSIGSLPAERRAEVGKRANAARVELEELFARRRDELERRELEQRLAQDRVDVTLPGDPSTLPGRLHIVTETKRLLEDTFVGLGFQVLEGPEVEYDYYNFTALNIPPGHPARTTMDTFYLDGEVVLRTHTSPMQVRAMEAQPPPLYVVVPGRVYRRDSDATHTPMFHQLEGLAVDEDITLADLQGVLLEFARAVFGPEREIRLRAGYFPFTEPSVEVDVSCFACPRDGSACRICKGSGWIEILGAGMVDPNVFAFVRDNGYDPERIQGFAFGLGIDRIAMLRYGVPDLRLLFENDVRFLEQFGV
ncbi:phenylalanine--tRNA ligase subunit alpha [Thermoleophilum album]|uniref:phenylalanine--tRNA ligase subunit alpha n=1 Tax=Thermoleophilum album TaxID=29539 RepID=UPI00237C868C|nr:phenylalanine--tRNA ligase subunit alpha [Thermoleophilum album]WDT94466.1 phenylalanine--tRNA ligase subunit alpha [Thermoleophilum album]